MKTDELKAFLEAQLAEAELHYIKCKKAYDAFNKATRTQSFKFPVVEDEKRRHNLKQLVLTALNSLKFNQPFTISDVFKAMQQDDLIYKNVRPRISMWLSKFVNDGLLEKRSRGVFIKVMRRTK